MYAPSFEFRGMKWNVVWLWLRENVIFRFYLCSRIPLEVSKAVRLCDKSRVCVWHLWNHHLDRMHLLEYFLWHTVRKLIPQNKFDLVKFFFFLVRAKSLLEKFPLTLFGKNEIINSLTIIESHDCLLWFTFTSCHSNMNNNKHYARGARNVSSHLILRMENWSYEAPWQRIFLVVYPTTMKKIMFTLKYDALLNERKGFFGWKRTFCMPFCRTRQHEEDFLFINIKFHVDVFIQRHQSFQSLNNLEKDWGNFSL